MSLTGNAGVGRVGTLPHLCSFSLSLKNKVLLFVCFKVTAVGNALPGLINSKMSLGSAGEVGRVSSSAVQISACWWLTPSLSLGPTFCCSDALIQGRGVFRRAACMQSLVMVTKQPHVHTGPLANRALHRLDQKVKASCTVVSNSL